MTLHPFSIWQGVMKSFCLSELPRCDGRATSPVKSNWVTNQRNVPTWGSWSTRRETATAEHTHWTQKEQLPPSEAIVLTMLILLAFRGVQAYREKKNDTTTLKKVKWIQAVDCDLMMGLQTTWKNMLKPSFIAEMDHRCSRNLAEIFGNLPTQKTSLLFVVGLTFASLQMTVIAFTCTRAGEN